MSVYKNNCTKYNPKQLIKQNDIYLSEAQRKNANFDTRESTC